MKLLLVQEKMIYWSYPGRIALSWLQSPVYLMGDKNNEMGVQYVTGQKPPRSVLLFTQQVNLMNE